MICPQQMTFILEVSKGERGGGEEQIHMLMIYYQVDSQVSIHPSILFSTHKTF